MNLEVLRVDPASRIPVGEAWAGFGLSEQRFPVTGIGWQLWGLSRLGTGRDARIERGMPLTEPFGSPHGLAQHLVDSGNDITEPPVTYEEALEFVLDIQFAPDSTLVDTRAVMGIAGAVRGRAWRRAKAESDNADIR